MSTLKMAYNNNNFIDRFNSTPIQSMKELGDGIQFRIGDNIHFPGPIALHKEFPFLWQAPSLDDNKNHCVGDPLHKFEENLKSQPEDWQYRTKKVEYNLNSNGYRAPEWDDVDWANSYVILGCSCTFGVGLAEDQTLSHHLASYLKAPVINLGYPGGSNQSIIYNLMHLLKKFPKPKGVIISWSTLDRALMFDKTGSYSLGPWDIMEYPPKRNITHDGTDRTEQYLTHFLDPYNEAGQGYMQGLTAETILRESGIPNYIFSWFQNTSHATRSPYIQEMSAAAPRARDLQHPGEQTMMKTARTITESGALK